MNAANSGGLLPSSVCPSRTAVSTTSAACSVLLKAALSVPTMRAEVPAGTSARIVGTLNAAFNKTLQAADVVDTAVREGQTLLGSSPPEFAAFIKVEFARYQKLVRDTGMRLE